MRGVLPCSANPSSRLCVGLKRHSLPRDITYAKVNHGTGMPQEMAMLHPVDGTSPEGKGPGKDRLDEVTRDRAPSSNAGAEPASKAEEMMAFLADRQRRNDTRR